MNPLFDDSFQSIPRLYKLMYLATMLDELPFENIKDISSWADTGIQVSMTDSMLDYAIKEVYKRYSAYKNNISGDV